ncbi:MAG: hypothetical protein KF884_06710 [Fimbriimonadaceae bacterium]|nr:hypothetical protein [Fimbriimonadaceae bacterium]QYK57241.1 MAG: hypothetical protein KF884_06710 [Fimbriimonadaceae bacterium]
MTAWEAHSARFGSLGEYGDFNEALELYYHDKLESAYAFVEAMGAGSLARGLGVYRMIEAEWATRTASSRQSSGDWLEIEWIPTEASWTIVELEAAIRHACDQVCQAFGWAVGPPTLFTVLARSADAPWTPGRHGYCVDMYPYEKVCLPNYLLNDRGEFEAAVRHEFAHVMTVNRAQGLCPRWFDEAVAMLADGTRNGPQWRRFRERHDPWRSLHALDVAFGEDRENFAGQRVVLQAYTQSHVIGEYLASLHGTRGVGDCLDRFLPFGFWAGLAARLKGRPAVDTALKKSFGMDADTVNEKALAWLTA